MAALTVSYKGKAGSWTGVVKLDGEAIVECGHTHVNRDGGSKFSAVSCVASLLYVATRPDLEGGPYCGLRRLHAEAAAAGSTLRRRGASKVATDEEVATRHAHIDQTIATLRAAIAVGATAPTRH